MYNIVQTGQKIQLGGLKKGFSKFVYQESIEFIVKNEEINPIKRGMDKDKVSLYIFFIKNLFIKYII
ncbi:MAG: hypothetical protein N4A38_02445 [Candidatus Gracilibacteria bacterium]|jgi:hypothetical protein|nr:hypothetical protein [Candidatus Gracilibacteria bacterium]